MGGSRLRSLWPILLGWSSARCWKKSVSTSPLAHEHPLVLQTLRLLANGESIPVRVGAAAQVSDHWQVVATFEVRLATDDYTILELELEGDQIAKRETRGLGIGQIVIGP